MKNIHIKLIILAALIDILGTTFLQIILSNIISNNAILIGAGSAMSIFAGYYLVSQNSFKIDINLFLLSLLTFLTGLVILFLQNAYLSNQFLWLSLTPILNIFGGYLANIQAGKRK